MNPIQRPPVWPPATTTVQPGRADARLTAQKAIFDAAMAGKKAAPPPPEFDPAPATPMRTAPRRETPAGDNLPRPGTYLDIRV